MVPVYWNINTFSFPVFKFSKYFPSHWKCQALYQLFHVRKAPWKIVLIPLVENTVGPTIPCISDIICCSLHSWRKCWNAKKQLYYSRSITVVKCSKLSHVVLHKQPRKVNMRFDLIDKGVAVIDIFPLFRRLSTPIIAIDVFILKQIFRSSWPCFEITRFGLYMNGVTALKLVVLLFNLLLHKWMYLWHKDLVECNSYHKPSFLIISQTKVAWPWVKTKRFEIKNTGRLQHFKM